jgi:hypothetical protein
MKWMDDLEQDIGALNEKLRAAGDPARVRYAWFEADPYLDDRWVVYATWELPDYRPDDPSAWPLETRDKYYRLLFDHYGDNPDVLTHCSFRTAGQLTEPAQQRGRPIPEPV